MPSKKTIPSEPNFSIHATSEVIIHLPKGSRIWCTMLMPDFDCDEERCQISIKVNANNTDIAKDVLRLINERLVVGLSIYE